MNNKQYSTSNSLLNEGYSNSKYYFDGGKGSKILLNNKEYIDLSFGAGSLILGHNSKIYKNSIKDITKKNLSILASPNKQAFEFSKLLSKIFKNYSKFIFCNSGTEAIFKTLRIARTISKKEKIVSVTGSWHGSADNLLFTANKKLKPEPLSNGLPNENKKNLIFIPYNDIKLSKKILDKNKKFVSCIIIEPIQGCLPTEKSKNYLKFLEKYSNKNKIILIFDEMITGLRSRENSVQAAFKIKPSISTFGKCLGGGMPIGIIAINRKIEKLLKKNKKKVFFGGTFSGNSISTYIGKKTTEFIFKNKKKIYQNLERKSIYFQDELNHYISNNNINAKIYRFGSLIRLVFSNKEIDNRLQRDFFEKNSSNNIKKIKNFFYINNINYPSNGLIFFSYSTSDKDIKKIIKIFKLGLKKFF